MHSEGRHKAGRSPAAGISPRDAAAESWIRRLEAGLSIEEEIEFADWLSHDPANHASLRKYRAAWERFEPLAQTARAYAKFENSPEVAHWHPRRTVDDRSEASPGSSRGKVIRRLAAASVLAAGFVVLLVILRGFGAHQEDALAFPPPCEHRTLADGSVVELNRGAQVTEQFSAGERRVRLGRGEAIFHVAKDPSRPFVVLAGVIEVRAVGTAFNVRLDPSTVEIVVTEGRVRVVDGPPGVHSHASQAPVPASRNEAVGEMSLGASQSAIIDVQAATREWKVTTLTPAELAARLSWKPKVIEFDDAPLSEIVVAFNRQNPVRLVVNDPVVASRRMTASFRSDNLEAFVRLVEMTIGVKAKRVSETEIALRRE